ncbi:LacI family DNA-binding transcriptional regulator [Pengzhenrongella sicca]|nr:LacI family DNA-binding transcriptional regulator [Pengzhenrongella sicca]
MRDVAREANVSVKTVSRVHNNDPHVAPDTRDRVEAAIRRMGYLPNTLATTFRDGRSAVIGIAVPDIGDPYFSAIVREVDRTAAQHHMLTVVAGIGGDPSQERARVEALMSRRLSGLIMAPVTNDQSYLLPWVDQAPIIFIDRRPTRLAVDSFTTDDEQGAFDGTAHLLAHGHRRVAFLGDTLSLATTAARLTGYRRALHEAERPWSPELVVMDGATRGGAALAVQTLACLPEPPTALLSSNARCTIALAPLLRNLGLAVVSFGDFPMSDVLEPAVTILDQHPHVLAEMAVNRLLDRLAHPAKRFRRRQVLAATLVERDSCRLPVTTRP